MAEQKKEEFLDEVEEAELDQDELIDIDAEAAELEKLDEVTAERDDYRDRFMRALADAENARKGQIKIEGKQRTTVDLNWRETFCQSMII